MSEGTDQSVYAAGQAREFLAGALKGKENTWIYEHAGLIDDSDVLDWLNYRCSLYEQHDKDFLETELAKTVIRSAATRTADRAFKKGAASQLQGLVGLTRHEEDGHELFSMVAESLAHEGSIGLMFGAPGSGKTAATIDSAMTWQARTGGVLIGNFEWDGFERVVKSDREMLEAMGEIEGPVLAVLDEIAQDLSGFGKGNKDAESFSNSLLLIRKRESQHGQYAKRGSVILVAHTRKKTAKPIREVASFGVEKPSRSDQGRARFLYSEGGKDVWEDGPEFKGVTDTAANYEEYDPSSFRIVGTGDEENDEDDVDADGVRDEEQIRTAIRAVEKHGMTYKEASELVSYGDTWVGERVREFRRGEHRDLFDDGEFPAKGDA